MQYLTRSGIPDVVHMIAVLVAINALTIVLAQFPLLHLLQRYSSGGRLLIGMLLMLAAQFLFAFSPLSSFFALGIATVILSLGELIVFPTFSVAVDQITPDAVRGSYFGAANLYSLGSALAPLYGGLMLDHLGGRALFLGLAALCALIMVLQGSANALKRTQEEEVQSS
ncbi:putative transporter [Serratia rubidaea]|uniref:Putative transporter n=1 Tax=Serratia rubidaea TaxID=61652 RepID=A0A4U9HD33_SERRU|nr:putative transporter [Serratia rubidaea]